MPEYRRKFSPQFKAEAVQMVIETGKPIAEVARDLGLQEGVPRVTGCHGVEARGKPGEGRTLRGAHRCLNGQLDLDRGSGWDTIDRLPPPSRGGGSRAVAGAGRVRAG